MTALTKEHRAAAADLQTTASSLPTAGAVRRLQSVLFFLDCVPSIVQFPYHSPTLLRAGSFKRAAEELSVPAPLQPSTLPPCVTCVKGSSGMVLVCIELIKMRAVKGKKQNQLKVMQALLGLVTQVYCEG